MRFRFRAVLIVAAVAAFVATMTAMAPEPDVNRTSGKWAVANGAAAQYTSSRVALAESRALASYGPFRVLNPQNVALVDSTDHASPAQFSAMMRDFPSLVTLVMIECSGTMDDNANLTLGRMIRAAGLGTYVPDGGSVRSGGVELLLAGRTRRIADGAEFAVHAWEDRSGRQASDYSAAAPENTRYLAYYREMGMSASRARTFYAMTNSVPFEDSRWLTGTEMRRWIQ